MKTPAGKPRRNPVILFVIAVISIASFLLSCSDDSTGPTEYQYTQIDSLFFQKDYDSVWITTVYPITGFQKMKLKKFRVSYDLFTNDQTDTMVSMSFNIGDGHISYGQTHNGIDCNGHFEYEYTFNKVLDSVQTPYYKVQHKGGNPSIYIVVRNLRAYKSY